MYNICNDIDEHATKPATIALSLLQSPVSLLSWYVEKYHEWCDTGANDDIENVFTKDDIIDWTMLYWCTDTVYSSIRLYYEQFNQSKSIFTYMNELYIDVPTAISQFPREAYRVPQKWLQYYMNIKQFKIHTSGGHWASFEQPELYADDLYQFVTQHTELGQYMMNQQSIHHEL